MKQLIPILMVLLFVAGPALAANIFDKPYSWIDNRTQELADPRGDCYSDGGCPSATYCLDAYTVAEHTFITVGNTTYNITENTFCNTGCSNALNACRPSPFWQLMSFLALVVVLALIILISSQFEVMGFWVMLLVFISSVGIVWMDVFSDNMSFLVQMLPFVIILFGIYHYARYYYKNKDKEESDEGEF